MPISNAKPIVALLLTLLIGCTYGSSYTADTTYYMGLVAGQLGNASVTNNYTTTSGTNARFTIPSGGKMGYCAHPSLQFAMWADPSANVIRTVDKASKVSTWLGVVGQAPPGSGPSGYDWAVYPPVSTNANGQILLYNPMDVSNCFYVSNTNTWIFFATINQYPYLFYLGANGAVSSFVKGRNYPGQSIYYLASFTYDDSTGTFYCGYIQQVSSYDSIHLCEMIGSLSGFSNPSDNLCSDVLDSSPAATAIMLSSSTLSVVIGATSTTIQYYKFSFGTPQLPVVFPLTFTNIVNLYVVGSDLYVVQPNSVFFIPNFLSASSSTTYTNIAGIGSLLDYDSKYDFISTHQATSVSLYNIVSLCIMNSTNNEYLIATQSSIRHLYKKTSSLPDLSVQVLETDPNLVIRLVKDYNTFWGFLYTATLASSHGTSILDVTAEIQALPFSAKSDFSIYQLATNYGMGGNLRSYPFYASGRQYALAGNPYSGPSVDGTGSNAFIHFNAKATIAIDPKYNNLYFSSPSEHIIRQCNMNGTVITVAGVPNASGSRDTSGNTPALLNTPTFLAIPSSSGGQLFFVQGYGNFVIRRLDLVSFKITTL